MPLEAHFSDADAYEIQMGRWSRQLAEPFLDFVGPLSNDQVLDVGCGTGSLVAAVLDRSKSCRVLGIDKSKAYVEMRVSDSGLGQSFASVTPAHFPAMLACSTRLCRFSYCTSSHSRR